MVFPWFNLAKGHAEEYLHRETNLDCCVAEIALMIALAGLLPHWSREMHPSANCAIDPCWNTVLLPSNWVYFWVEKLLYRYLFWHRNSLYEEFGLGRTAEPLTAL